MRSRLKTIWTILKAPFTLIYWVIRLVLDWLWGIIKDTAYFFSPDEPDDSPLADSFIRAVNEPLAVVEHLNALRRNLLRAVLFLLLTTVVSFTFADKTMAFLSEPVGGIEQLQAIGVTEPIGVFMRVSLLTGFAGALPYIAFETLRFASSGLKRRERLTGLFSLPLVLLLFLGGMAFAYFYLLEPALGVLIGFMGIPTTPQPASYFPFVTGLMFWIGVAFEFPLIIYLVVAMGLIRANVLLENSRIAVVILAVLAAAITPTVDPINMMLVWGPLVLLYFLGVGLAFLAQRSRDRRTALQQSG